METLNNQDINNIINLINRSHIEGKEALTVALIQDKLTKMLVAEAPKEVVKEEEKK